MPTWGEILGELSREAKAKPGITPFDAIRRKYLKLLFDYTGRQTILYATKWTQSGAGEPGDVSINDEDIQGLMEVVYQLKEKSLDIILHSPGGSPEAAEAIVSYLRSKFEDIRVIVPQAAMSAATMIACASDVIVLGKHSSLGPIDPQFIIQTSLGVRAVPAYAIINQFKLAQEDCADPKKLSSWLPILSQYGPGLLIQCENANRLSKALVGEWLDKYMFKNKPNNKSNEIAQYLAHHDNFKSHGRHISFAQAEGIGLNVLALESDHGLQESVLSLFHATMHTLTGSPAVKIIENHLGRAFIKQKQQQIVVQHPPGKTPSLIPIG